MTKCSCGPMYAGVRKYHLCIRHGARIWYLSYVWRQRYYIIFQIKRIGNCWMLVWLTDWQIDRLMNIPSTIVPSVFSSYRVYDSVMKKIGEGSFFSQKVAKAAFSVARERLSSIKSLHRLINITFLLYLSLATEKAAFATFWLKGLPSPIFFITES